MMQWNLHRRATSTVAMVSRLCSTDHAAQIVELAVSLPLLVVFVVGIFDFSGAFTVKQKLTNAAREGARVAAAAPANDIGNPSSAVPASVDNAYRVIDNYLVGENISDCGLTPSTAPTQSALTWTYSSATGCPAGGITVAINRGYVFPPTGASIPTACASQKSANNVVGTCVSITYAYKWRFNSVITLLVPGASYAGVTNLNTTAVAFNEN